LHIFVIILCIGLQCRNPILKNFPADLRNIMKLVTVSGRKQSYGAGIG
jgi:hypothetical protein